MISQIRQGKVHIFGNNIDTDQIYPAKYLEYTELEDIKQHALSGSPNPNFVNEVKPGRLRNCRNQFWLWFFTGASSNYFKSKSCWCCNGRIICTNFLSQCYQSWLTGHYLQGYQHPCKARR